MLDHRRTSKRQGRACQHGTCRRRGTAIGKPPFQFDPTDPSPEDTCRLAACRYSRSRRSFWGFWI